MGPIVTQEGMVLFLLVFFRVLALTSVLPVIGSGQIPTLVKAGFAALMSLLVVAAMTGRPIQLPGTLGGLALAAAGETLLGLAMGFAVRAALEAVNFAGDLLGFQMGLSVASVIDPQSGLATSVIGNFQMMAAALIFIVTGLDRRFLGGLMHSFDLLAPGTAVLREGGGETFVRLGAGIYSGAISVGAPWLVVLLLTNVGLGLMARAVPQMNVFFVGFPLTIFVGLVVIALATPFVFEAIAALLEHSERDFWAILRSAIPKPT